MAINNPLIPGDPYSYDLKWIVSKLQEIWNELDTKAQQIINERFDTIDFSQLTQDAVDALYEDGTLREIIDGLFTDYEAAIRVLVARMDTFASLPSGSTSGNAELEDIRVWYDGQTSNSAGNAVRGQVSALHSDIEDVLNGNVRNGVIDFNKLAFTENNGNLLDLTVLTDGWIYGSGVIQSGSQKTSDFIPVDGGDVIRAGYFFDSGVKSQGLAIFSWCVFDEDYNVISHYAATNETVINVPATGKYVRLSLNPAYFSAHPVVYKNTTDMPMVTFSQTIPSKYFDLPMIIVAQDGSGSYTSITNAIAAAADGSVIFIKPGTYQERIIITEKTLTLIGSDREKVIIKETTGTYANSPMFVSGNLTISNLTISQEVETLGENTGYALHVDKVGAGTIRFSNCKFYTNAGAALGAGGQADQKVVFDDCEFIADIPNTDGEPDSGYSYFGAVFLHAPTSPGVTGCSYVFHNCIFRSTLSRVFTFSSPQDQSILPVSFINCLAYSSHNRFTNIAHFNRIGYVVLQPDSYGNSAAELNV